MHLAIKVDVDTLAGYREGVPSLLALFQERGIRASFFVAMGPDNSGQAIWRLFRRKGFLHKMLRTRAPQLYGLRTLAYGTLLPAPMIVAAAPGLLPEVVAAGHELGIHGYDHVYWQDHLNHLPQEAIHLEILRAQKTFIKVMGYPAKAFAAPGWQCNPASQAVLAAEDFLYVSNTRGYCPYFPRYDRQVFPTLEIPTTLPTLDELLGLNGRTAGDFNQEILARLRPGQVEVLTVHAEAEGRIFKDDFARLLDQLQGRGVKFLRLGDWVQELLSSPTALLSAPVTWGTLPGRAGEVACQGPLEGQP
ncbi:MAG: 4-deoxy-4-formamido-L-arabinose-phosphoundecaprenol deformylase [Deltaproteobacteria bacterium]|nr:4-deoxy-4-formamido-L-arabinose-phosphoundecaprenol deformylase [Deltaproteobacteria bacterium]MBW1952826.1 4-deoxy-4-formamido-L-arabinose-phosphoundecaprenol deformylase [Deltaproteobacteria bacterium]MBW1986782.1 4-deoxy-4-formamido-L-arabinose-phosphoundecaprenol deformylase [Deltaproteobacteria bacterium]MBW2135286.1 4-deoxy-4-formamido-L-arabinose-phosphoundecaprenol deformylase [Deltaproteobacteria bacterium]